MFSLPRSLPALLTGGVVAVALTGCAVPAPAETEGVSVVASTNVYGSIASTLAGDRATVTSIIDSAAQDPHSYEASAQDQLAIATADIVIENGGGYDPFIDLLVDGSGTNAVVVSAVDASGLFEDELAEADDDHAGDDHAEDDHAEDDHAGDDHAEDDHDHVAGVNEHVWYDLHSVARLAEAITDALVAADPAGEAEFTAQLESFVSELDALEAEVESRASELGGGTVIATEPVPVYLLAELGFDDVTPADFSEAIEEGTDVPPLALQQTLELLDSGQLALLAYNDQTTSPETERVRDAAEAAGIPIVSFAETLPEGQDYVSWMTGNVEAVVAALMPA